jgi:hypothetical protein
MIRVEVEAGDYEAEVVGNTLTDRRMNIVYCEQVGVQMLTTSVCLHKLYGMIFVARSIVVLLGMTFRKPRHCFAGKC